MTLPLSYRGGHRGSMSIMADDAQLNGNALRSRAIRCRRLVELAAFFAEHGRPPYRSAANGISELRLASWWEHNRPFLRPGFTDSGAERPHRPVAATNVENWQGRREELAQFIAEHGRAPVASSADRDERSIVGWMNRQRHSMRSGQLADELVAALDETLAPLGVKGAASNTARSEREWGQALSHVVAFVEEHQRLPSRESTDDRERSLGVWLQRQRRYERKGTLAAGRIDVLDSALDWRRDLDVIWEQHFEDLKAFVAEHGCTPPTRKRTDGHADELRNWWQWNRAALDAGADDARARTLREWVGEFDQDLPTSPRQLRWLGRLSELQRFRADRDGRLPSTHGDTGEKRLAFWVRHQRRLLTHGRLPETRAAMLKPLLATPE